MKPFSFEWRRGAGGVHGSLAMKTGLQVRDGEEELKARISPLLRGDHSLFYRLCFIVFYSLRNALNMLSS